MTSPNDVILVANLQYQPILIKDLFDGWCLLHFCWNSFPFLGQRLVSRRINPQKVHHVVDCVRQLLVLNFHKYPYISNYIIGIFHLSQVLSGHGFFREQLCGIAESVLDLLLFGRRSFQGRWWITCSRARRNIMYVRPPSGSLINPSGSWRSYMNVLKLVLIDYVRYINR